MPYIAHDTNVIYAAANTAAAALAEAEKDLRNRLPTEDIDKALKSLEVHEATTALVNDSNFWVKWAYLKNGVAHTHPLKRTTKTIAWGSLPRPMGSNLEERFRNARICRCASRACVVYKMTRAAVQASRWCLWPS